MAKTNHYFRQKRFFRILIYLSVVQIAIILLICIGFSGYEKAIDANTETASFYADEVIFSKTYGIGRLASNDISITIVYNSVRYSYDTDCDGWRSQEELLDSLEKEQLFIIYMTESNRIVDIRSSTTIYYTIDDYNAEQTRQIILGVFAIAFAEIVFLLAALLYIALYKPKRKRQRRKQSVV